MDTIAPPRQQDVARQEAQRKRKQLAAQAAEAQKRLEGGDLSEDLFAAPTRAEVQDSGDVERVFGRFQGAAKEGQGATREGLIHNMEATPAWLPRQETSATSTDTSMDTSMDTFTDTSTDTSMDTSMDTLINASTDNTTMEALEEEESRPSPSHRVMHRYHACQPSPSMACTSTPSHLRSSSPSCRTFQEELEAPGPTWAPLATTWQPRRARCRGQVARSRWSRSKPSNWGAGGEQEGLAWGLDQDIGEGEGLIPTYSPSPPTLSNPPTPSDLPTPSLPPTPPMEVPTDQEPSHLSSPSPTLAPVSSIPTHPPTSPVAANSFTPYLPATPTSPITSTPTPTSSTPAPCHWPALPTLPTKEHEEEEEEVLESAYDFSTMAAWLSHPVRADLAKARLLPKHPHLPHHPAEGVHLPPPGDHQEHYHQPGQEVHHRQPLPVPDLETHVDISDLLDQSMFAPLSLSCSSSPTTSISNITFPTSSLPLASSITPSTSLSSPSLPYALIVR